jgi:hypothetical protein
MRAGKKHSTGDRQRGFVVVERLGESGCQQERKAAEGEGREP